MANKSYTWNNSTTENITFNAENEQYYFSVTPKSNYIIDSISLEGSEGVIMTNINDDKTSFIVKVPTGGYINSISINTKKKYKEYTAVFFQSRSETHRVDKTNYIDFVSEQEIRIIEPSSIVNPVLVIEYSKLPDFNYVYIPMFNRYYYINEIISVRNKIWELHLSVDVLMSFKDTIKTQMGNVIRQENIGNIMMQDSNLPVLQNPSITYIDFGSNTFDQEFKQFVDKDIINFVVVTQGEDLQF